MPRTGAVPELALPLVYTAEQAPAAPPAPSKLALSWGGDKQQQAQVRAPPLPISLPPFPTHKHCLLGAPHLLARLR